MTNFNIIKLDAIDSTNDYLKNKFHISDCNDGDVIWTLNQTKGRGQRSNNWFSDPQKNITFSVFKRFLVLKSDQFFLINCSVTLAIVKFLEHFNVPDVKIKWPNDILSANKKIGGVLIENFVKGGSLKGTIIGVGINVNQTSFINLPSASSMSLQCDKEFDLNLVFDKLLGTLNFFLKKLNNPNRNHLLNSFQKLIFKKGEWCQFKKNSIVFYGKIIGVNSNGKLLIQNKSCEVTQHSNGSIEMIY